MRDEKEQIDTIKWTVYGKIKSIRRLFDSSKPDLEFKYDASGNRIAKIEKPHGSSKENGGTDIVSQWKTTYYVRDAQGNVMSNYYYVNPGTASYKLIERDLYGSDRLGTENTQLELIGALPLAQPFTRVLGNKYFEGKNHLGNVLSVFTDKKIPRDDNNNGIIDYFQPEVLSCNDYTAFGAPMNERNFSISQNAGAVIYQSNFSSGVDGWVNNWPPASNTTISTVSSQLKVIANVTWGGVNHKVATIPGKQYRYTLNIASITNLSPYDLSYFARRMDSVNILVQAATQPGVYSLVFTAQETFTYLCVELNKAGASMQIASAKLELLPDLNYRYGFNGKEKDDEVKGAGNDYDFGARIYDPRLGRFLSMDPLAHKYAGISPYAFCNNSPIQYVELDGRDYDYSVTMIKNKDGSMTKVVNINVVYNVVNLSNKEVNSGDFNRSAAVLNRNLNYNTSQDAKYLKGVKDVKVNVTVSFNIVTDYSKINDKQNVLFVVDKAGGSESSSTVGVANFGGNIAIVQADYIDYNSLDKFAAVVIHEVLHNLGVNHGTDKNSVMWPETNGTTNITTDDQKNFDYGNSPSFKEGSGHMGTSDSKVQGKEFLKKQSTSYNKDKAKQAKVE